MFQLSYFTLLQALYADLFNTLLSNIISPPVLEAQELVDESLFLGLILSALLFELHPWDGDIVDEVVECGLVYLGEDSEEDFPSP